MNIVETSQEIRQYLTPLRHERIAFVPTMGCLHEGHISLIRKAKRLADIVVVSIYVNPLQFGENEDFDTYPKTFDNDVEICKKEGIDCLFHPHNLYPEDGMKVSLQINDMQHVLCGKSRPNHFNGVLTVVNILFNIIQPQIAIFGEKDWQQLAIIKRMVSDLHMPVEIIGSEIIREDDGLAMSSRNRYLNPKQRQQAVLLSQTLTKIKNNIKSHQKTAEIIQISKEELENHHISIDYIEILDETTLKPLASINSKARIFIAAYIGNTRLIDNSKLTSMEKIA